MRMPLLLDTLGVVLALTVSLSASSSGPGSSDDSVLFMGQIYCEQLQYCPDFAFWGNSPSGYVELTKADGTPTDYLWVDISGQMTFESSPLKIRPPAGLPLVGTLVADGTYQEVDQFFPAGSNRPLFIQSHSGQK